MFLHGFKKKLNLLHTSDCCHVIVLELKVVHCSACSPSVSSDISTSFATYK